MDHPSSEELDRASLRPLFATHRFQRTAIDGILEGRYGFADADPARPPVFGEIRTEPFHFLAGDRDHPAAAECLAGLPAGAILLVPDAPWQEAALRARPGGISTEPRLAFSHASLQAGVLNGLASRVPDGWEVRALDAGLAAQALRDVSPDLIVPDVFATPAELARDGLGYVAIRDGQLACAATSAFIASGSIEIQINTAPEHRRQGLATVVAATLILACLERGLEPHWDTASPVSERLARRLGYTPAEAHAWLIVG